MCQGGKIHSFSWKKLAFRIEQGILDWQFHIRCSKLGHNSTIFKFDHGMNQALRLDYDLYLIKINSEQPLCLNHFKSFIYHGCRIYRYLLTHCPVRMLQCLFHGNILHLLFFPSAERTTRCRQKNLFRLFDGFSVEALEDRTVFTINRQNLYFHFLCKPDNNMSCCYQCFLVCQCNILPCLNCLDCRNNSYHSHKCRNYNVGCFDNGCFDQTVHTGNNPGLRILYAAF